MAIRRRRRKLTNLLSTLDRRVKSLELRPIDLLSGGELAVAEATADAVDVIVSDNAPNQYRPIEKAYFYGAAVSGSSPRVEVFLGANPDVKENEIFQVSGLNGSATEDLELSGDDFKVVSASSEPWDGDERKNFQYTPTDQEPELTNSVLYATDVAAPEGTSSPIELITKVEIASYQGADSTIRINLTGQHKFKVGDVVYVELGVENPIVFGRDGLFRLTNVDPSFIEYEIATPLVEPIGETPVVTITRHVYAVAHKFVREGATWIDSSGDSDSVFVWRDIRWVAFSEYAGDDGVPPAPVTELEGTSESRAVDGITSSVARVTLTWKNPTENAEGNPLDDFLGVQVWHRYTESEPFEKGDVILGDDETWTKDGFEVKRGGAAVSTVTFRVYAVDSGGLLSEPAEIDVEITPAAKQIKAPTAPQVKQYLGTPTFTWDGLQADQTLPPVDAYEVEVHISTIDGFAISDGTFQEGTGTFYGSFLAEPGGYLVLNANDLTDANTYYVRFVLTDIHGNKETSAQSSFVADVDKPVKFDVIDVGTLEGQLITGLEIQTGPNVNDGSGSDQNGVILTRQGIRAYDRDGELTFAVDANNGTVRLLNNLTINGYLTETEAELRYGNIDLTLDGDEIIQAINEATGGGEIQGTRISDQGILAPVVASNKFVSAEGGAINSAGTVIDGSKITTGFLSANRISGGTIDASKITVSNLSADNITSGTLSGRTVVGRLQTKFSDGNPKRIILSESTNTIKFFASGDSNSNHKGLIEANGSGLSIQSAVEGTNLEVRSGSMFFELGSSLRSGLDMTPNAWLAKGPRKSGKSRGEVRLEDGYTKIDCADNGGQMFLFPGTNKRAEIRIGQFRVNALGGSGTSTAQLDSSGYLRRSSSDSRIKKDVKNLNLGLDFINKLRPVKFKYDIKSDGSDDLSTNYGLLAQEVEQILVNDFDIKGPSNLLHTFTNKNFTDKLPEDEQIYVLDYPSLIPMLINSIKELSHEIDYLKNKIERD